MQTASPFSVVDYFHSLHASPSPIELNGPPDSTGWFFHDSPAQLDDPNAPLPTATASSSPANSKIAENSINKDGSSIDNEIESQPKTSDLSENLGAAFKNAVADASKVISDIESDKPLVDKAIHEPIFSLVSGFTGSVGPNPAWNAFNPVDRQALEAAYLENPNDSDPIVVGFNRLYYASLATKLLTPLYWQSPHGIANIHRATWFHSTSLAPIEPSLESAVMEAYLNIRPWTLEYFVELKSALEVPEAMKMICVPIEYSVKSETGFTTYKVTVVFAPCKLQTDNDKKEEGPELDSDDPLEVNAGEHPEAEDEQLGADSEDHGLQAHEKELENHENLPTYTVAHIFPISLSAGPSSLPIPLPFAPPSPSQLISCLLSGRTHPSALFTIQRHFDWDSWKKLKNLPDRPTDQLDYKPKRITQLLLVIHGIGQKLSDRVESFNFTYAINSFRILISEQASTEGAKQYIEEGQEIMTLPVNWRRTLKFEDLSDGGGVSGLPSFSLADISLDSIPAVRGIISDVLLDIPLYMSRHKKKMLAAAVKEANRVYRLFVKHNPGFDQYGTVNIVGHSLGSVIAADLLSSQPTNFEISSAENDRCFCFDTKNLFLCGSPFSFFMLLENKQLYPRKAHDEKNPDSPPPYGCLAVKNIYNFLHFSDPIAYRLNPTVDMRLSALIDTPTIPGEKQFPAPILKPEAPGFLDSITLKLSYYTPTKRSSTVDSVDNGDELTSDESTLQETVVISKDTDKMRNLPEMVEMETRNFSAEYQAEDNMRMLNENGQIDWVIPLSGIDNQYVSMISAHTSYWDNKDFARMVAIECGRKDGPENALTQFMRPGKNN